MRVDNNEIFYKFSSIIFRHQPTFHPYLGVIKLIMELRRNVCEIKQWENKFYCVFKMVGWSRHPTVCWSESEEQLITRPILQPSTGQSDACTCKLTTAYFIKGFMWYIKYYRSYILISSDKFWKNGSPTQKNTGQKQSRSSKIIHL